MSRWKRILVSLGIVVIVTLANLWFFGTQTFFALEAHNIAGKLPFVKLDARRADRCGRFTTVRHESLLFWL
jgi:hypothetical protein